MKNTQIVNADKPPQIWFRCMEKREGHEGKHPVSGWHMTQEEAWWDAATNNPKMKEFVWDHLARGKLHPGSGILMNLKFVAENEDGTMRYRCGRSWQLTWSSRRNMIENWETDLSPA